LNRKKYGTKLALSFPISWSRRKVADEQGNLYNTEQYDFLYSSNNSGSYQAKLTTFLQEITLNSQLWTLQFGLGNCMSFDHRFERGLRQGEHPCVDCD